MPTVATFPAVAVSDLQVCSTTHPHFSWHLKDFVTECGECGECEECRGSVAAAILATPIRGVDTVEDPTDDELAIPSKTDHDAEQPIGFISQFFCDWLSIYYANLYIRQSRTLFPIPTQQGQRVWIIVGYPSLSLD